MTELSAPTLEHWLAAPHEEIQRYVGSALVLGWPFNGTRRWYMSHHGQGTVDAEYLTLLIRRQAEQHRLALSLGAAAIATPSFGYELLERGPRYVMGALAGILQLADDQVYQDLFAQGVQMRFYGDYRAVLSESMYAPLLAACEQLMVDTAQEGGPAILLGLFADQPYDTIARLSVEFAARTGRPPNRAELIAAYYGLPLPDLNIYIGFEQPALFDVPLLTTGREDLYVTLNPSPDVSERQLREILYDHLFTRRMAVADYSDFGPEAQQAVIAYTQRCSEATFGTGRLDPVTGMWRPSFASFDRALLED